MSTKKELPIPPEMQKGVLLKEMTVDDELVQNLEELKESESLGALSVFPQQVTFETQEEDEQVVLVMRKAPVTNIKWALIAGLLALMPAFIVVLGVLSDYLDSSYLLVAMIVWELFVVGYIFEEFLRWFFNIYIVTDRRVVDIDYPNFLWREVSDVDLLKIQDVTTRNQGIMAAIFNFGDIWVLSAAEMTTIEYLAVKEADNVAGIIRLLAQARERVVRGEGGTNDG